MSYTHDEVGNLNWIKFLREALFKAIQFENKAAHATAFLLSSPHIDNPHTIDKGMLGNLFYLAERRCIATHGQLLFMDPPTANLST